MGRKKKTAPAATPTPRVTYASPAARAEHAPPKRPPRACGVVLPPAGFSPQDVTELTAYDVDRAEAVWDAPRLAHWVRQLLGLAEDTSHTLDDVHSYSREVAQWAEGVQTTAEKHVEDVEEEWRRWGANMEDKLGDAGIDVPERPSPVDFLLDDAPPVPDVLP